MNQEKIMVANLKCNGCATTIKKELLKIKGVTDVRVDLEDDVVEVSYSNSDVDRGAITKKLHFLGYPEATEKNGLLLQLKSYASCMVGRVG
jgi:copper chaperone